MRGVFGAREAGYVVVRADSPRSARALAGLRVDACESFRKEFHLLCSEFFHRNLLGTVLISCRPSILQPVGDMLFVIPGKLAQTFYHGIDQLMFPNCCECKPKMCRYQSEPTFMRFFAGMRLLQIDVLPFPFALFRPTGGKWPTGAECFRWGPPYYQEARYFNDSFPREACSRAARKLSWIDAVNPRYMKINKTVEYENLASVGACEGTGNPYLQGEKHPVEGHKMVYSDFRNYTSSWLNY
mmetsp:Transcript_19424/g.51632  ORF Transcript_19424/g.51632 Transcript_19424/m.51632 type:complete len:241 (-) Transcript_19424:35-757(-)